MNCSQRRLGWVCLSMLLLSLGSAETANAQTVSLSATSVKFGNQAVGTTSAAKSVRLTNTGTATLVVSSITAPTAPFADPHMGTTPCPTSASFSVAPKASCTVSYTFSPTTTGTFTTTVSIFDNAAGSPQVISLSGTGVPQATLSAASLNFGNVGVGTTASKTITLNNNLNTPLSFTATASGDFAVTGNSCAGTVSAGGHCSITATMTPTQLGARTGTLAVTDSATNSPQIAALTGTGTVSSVSAISVACVGSTISVGSTDQCTATGTFPGGIMQNLTTLVTWSSSSTKVATVSNSTGSQGLVTGKAAGNTTIKASITVNESTKSGSTTLTVTSGGLITPTITWPAPAPIIYGTPLSAMQLDATASAGGTTIPGTFTYTPPATTVLPAGTQTLSVLFTPTDTTHYTTATASVSMTVNKATATVTFSNLTQTYTGAALSPTITTVPSVSTILMGAPDTNAGTYPVTATVNNSNYTGSASGSFVISPAAATVMLSNLTQTYDGTPKSATVTTTPTGLGVSVAYNGLSTPPLNAGSYTVVASLTNANYTATNATGTLVISPAAATVTANAASKVYGSPDPTLTASETGFTTADAATIALSASRAPGENVGTYTITPLATGSSTANYTFTYQSANLTITQATPAFSNLTASQTITAGAVSINLAGTIAAGSVYPPSGEMVTITINGSSVTTTIGASGSFPVVFPTAVIPASSTPYLITYSYPGDANFTNATNAATTLTVNQAAATLVSITITPANASVALGGTQQFSATGSYSDNSTQNLTASATWTSTATKVATLSNAPGTQGLATVVGLGVTGITATLNGITGSTKFLGAGADVFVPTGNMQIGRDPFTATLLLDGTVLITGGYSSGGITNTAELYDSAGVASSPIQAPMTSPRADHTASLLNNGKILLAGGNSGNGFVSSAELYDPVQRSFTPTGSMGTARTLHTATVLQDGTVLLVGGEDGNANGIASAELYNPVTGVFTPVGSLTTGRYSHTATLLYDGTVLIIGGAIDGNLTPTATAELYNPATHTFSSVGNMTSARIYHTATLLNDGSVMVTGGVIDTYPHLTDTAEWYISGTFSGYGHYLSSPRASHTATLLNNSNVLIAGGAVDATGNFPPVGNPTGSADMYFPAGGFRVAASLTTGRSQHTATLLTNGSVLIAGGTTDNVGTTTNSVELYQPSSFAPGGLVSINVTPANTHLAAGTSQRYIATGAYAGNVLQQLACVTWTASDVSGANVAAVSNDASNQGLALASSPGTASIAANLGTISGEAMLTVSNLNGVSVTPTAPIIPLGTTQQFTATAILSGGGVQDLTSLVTWSSTAPVSISPSGLASSTSQGVSTITATFGATSGATTVTVGPPALVSIAINPVSPIQVNGTQLFTAIGTFTDGGKADLSTTATPASWGSSDMTVATINTSTGVALGLNIGQTTITAAVGAISNTTTLYVTNVAIGAASMNLPRVNHRGVILGNGQVLLTGGICCANLGATSSAELYDPATGTFTLTSAGMSTQRQSHTATVLNDGRVLIVGGRNNVSTTINILASAELYDPTSNSFLPTGNLNQARDVHTATRLNDGTVLITGGHYFLDPSGVNEVILATAETYNPASGMFTYTHDGSGNQTQMSTPRLNHTATLLNNGKVLIAGGHYLNGNSDVFLSTAELYDPASGIFTATSNTMQIPRDFPTATLLEDGRVLFAGGDPTGGNSTEIYDPVSDMFLPNPTGVTSAGWATTLLNNGTVVLTGVGPTSSGTLLYDPSSGNFMPTGSLNQGRILYAQNLLNDGAVLLTGGLLVPSSNTYLGSVELYPPSTLSPSLPAPQYLVGITVTPTNPSITAGTSHQFIATGTFNNNSTVYVQQLASVVWSSANSAVVAITNDASNPGVAYAAGTIGQQATITACAGSVCSPGVVVTVQ